MPRMYARVLKKFPPVFVACPFKKWWLFGFSERFQTDDFVKFTKENDNNNTVKKIEYLRIFRECLAAINEQREIDRNTGVFSAA